MMKKIVIIGAGPAGLTAGYQLLKQARDCEVTVLEESEAFGGISRTVDHKGNRMDIGGHRFFSKNPRVTAMWEELMPLQGAPAFDDLKLSRTVELSSGGPDPETDDRVMLSRTRISRIFYKKKFIDYPVKMDWNSIRNIGFGTAFASLISYLWAKLHKLPEKSLENFYINQFGYKLYSIFFEGYTEKIWGSHPRDISADWGAQRVKGLSFLTVLKDIFTSCVPGMRNEKKTEVSLIRKFNYPKYGPGQLWETVADEIRRMGGKIITGCKAESLVNEGNLIRKVVCRLNDEKVVFDADIVISSMPLKDLVRGMTDVPAEIANIANGLPYRDFVTVGILLDGLLLKNNTSYPSLNNIIPDCWIYVQDAGFKLGRIQIFNNWSPYMVRDPEHTVWIGLEYFCTEGDVFWNMSPDEWTKTGIDELIRMGICAPGAQVKDSHVEKVKKAYPAYFGTYPEINKLIRYLDTFENLYCIGRNGQHRYNNMDHSMLTAFETVDCIISGSKSRSAVWSVNTEQGYHEEG